MSLRDINDQIERELSMPEPAFVVRIWFDEEGQVQSERVPNVRAVEGIAQSRPGNPLAHQTEGLNSLERV